MPSQPSYPTIKFVVRYGGILSISVAVLPFLSALWAMAFGMAWWIVPVGLVASAVLWLLMRSYVELMRVVSDTLLPR